MDATKPLNIENLSYAAVDVQSIDVDYSYDENLGDSRFRLASELNIGVEVECPDCEDGEVEIDCPNCGGSGEVDDDGTGESSECDDCGGSGTDTDDCQNCDGKGEYDPDEGYYGQWEPLVNYAWPAPHLSIPDNWRELLCNMTIIEDQDGNNYFALTGCGMDFSWAIAETYIEFGYYPPSTLRLPRMAGRGYSAKDKSIIAAMRKSLECQRDRVERALEDLDDLAKSAAEYEAKQNGGAA